MESSTSQIYYGIGGAVLCAFVIAALLAGNFFNPAIMWIKIYNMQRDSDPEY